MVYYYYYLIQKLGRGDLNLNISFRNTKICKLSYMTLCYVDVVLILSELRKNWHLCVYRYSTDFLFVHVSHRSRLGLCVLSSNNNTL